MEWKKGAIDSSRVENVAAMNTSYPVTNEIPNIMYCQAYRVVAGIRHHKIDSLLAILIDHLSFYRPQVCSSYFYTS